jgi:hypothetical protein
MTRFYVFLLVLALSASCGNEAVKEKAEEQNYYLEFVNLEGSNVSEWTIRAVKQKLVGKGYYYGAEPHAGQWIRGIGYVDSANMALLSEHFTKVHRFRDISEYDPSDKDAEKIVITYNPLTKNDIANFNFHSYRKLGGDEWQSVFNPGNFRFSHAHPEGQEKDLGVWMSELIVKLTFK